MSAGGLLPGETSGTVEIPEEMMEFLAPVLEVINAGGSNHSSCHGGCNPYGRDGNLSFDF